jgi:hypothetical protein
VLGLHLSVSQTGADLATGRRKPGDPDLPTTPTNGGWRSWRWDVLGKIVATIGAAFLIWMATKVGSFVVAEEAVHELVPQHEHDIRLLRTDVEDLKTKALPTAVVDDLAEFLKEEKLQRARERGKRP